MGDPASNMQTYAFFLCSLACPMLVADARVMSTPWRTLKPLTTQAVYSPCSMKAFLNVMARSAPASPPSTGTSK